MTIATLILTLVCYIVIGFGLVVLFTYKDKNKSGVNHEQITLTIGMFVVAWPTVTIFELVYIFVRWWMNVRDTEVK